MLKGIDPLLGPELLATLRAMGHGDEIVIADANFPAAANARRLIRLEGADGPRTAQAILSVLPLDDFVPDAAFRMADSAAPGVIPPVCREYAEALAAVGYDRAIAPIERHAFYARAREAYAIVATGEPRFWGNLILKKGAIPPRVGGVSMRVDAHQHFWRIDRGDYGWLTPEDTPGLYRDYLPDDLAPLLAQSEIDRTVLVQAAESDAETDFLLALAETTSFVGAVVGWVDFESPKAPERIFELAKNPYLRGLRPMLQDLPDPDWILREAVQPAIRATQRAGLRFDALIKPPQLPAMRKLLARYPDLPVVIDHGAKPPIADGDIDGWAQHMRAIAAGSRALCKLSGLATEAAPGWTLDTLRPYVEVLLKAFGPRRLMFGSDWPVLTGNGDYIGWLGAAHDLCPLMSVDERAQVFGGTAARFYGLQ